MDKNNTVINLADITFAYEAERPAVLSRFNLALRSDERLALTGPNGSGKTTILHIIVGLLKPQAGSVEVLGQKRSDEQSFRDVRARVGLLFQNAEDQLFSPTVAEDVAFGPLNLGRTHEEAMDITAHTLRMLGLAGFQSRITHHLSEGEKKLVALATVLAMQPEVLLLDEPTAELDERARHRVIEVINGLGKSLIIVSHDADLLDAVATSRCLLKDGQIQRL